MRSNKSKIILTTIMLILGIMLINSALASVSDFGLEYNGQPITRISLNYPLTTTAVFKVDTDVMPFKIVANFSQLVRNPFYQQQYQGIIMGANACSWDNSSERIKCGLENVIINPENATVNLNFQIYRNATNFTNSTLFHTFDIDNDAPTLLSVNTEFCYEDRCYIKSGENNLMAFEFDDNSEQFIRNRVFYSFNNNKYPVHDCADGTCYAYASKICTSGQNFLTKLITVGTYKTEDDAGNPALSDVEEQFYCDSLTPYNNGLGGGVSYDRHSDVYQDESSIEFIAGDSDYGLIVGAKPLEIKAYVFEDGPTLEGEVNLTSIGGEFQRVACTNAGQINLFICDFSVAQLENEHLQEELGFSFYDIVNNSASTTKEITVLKNAGANATTPNCINLDEGDFKPAKINRIALDLAQTSSLTYPIYAPYNPLRKSGSSCSEININQQIIADCWITLTNGSTMPAFGNVFDDSSAIKYPYRNAGLKNYIDLPITSITANAIMNTELICNLSFYLSDDEQIYEEPLIKQGTWDVEFLNSALGRPGKEYTKQVKKAEKNVNSGLSSAIGIINDGLATASLLCNTKNMITNTLGSTKIVLDGVDIARDYAGLVSPGQPASSNLISEMLTYLNGNEEGKAIKNEAVATLASIFDYSCLASSCGLEQYLSAEDHKKSNVWNKFYLGTLTGDGTEASAGQNTNFDLDFYKQELFANIGRPDLYNSVIACASVGCLPGIAYHANKYREAECERLYCIKRQAQYGASIESCDVAKKTFTCKQITGEIFELPYLRDIKNLADNANHLAQNFVPTTLSQFFSSQLCTESYSKVISGEIQKVGDLNEKHIIMCEIPLSIGRFIRGQRMTNKAGSFTYPSSGLDICEMALCNEEDESKCEQNIGWIGNQLPNYVYNMIDTNEESAEDHMRRLQTIRRSMGGGQNFMNAMDNYFETIDNVRDNEVTNEDKKNYQDAAERLRYSYGMEMDTDYDTFKDEVLSTSNVEDTIYTNMKEGLRVGREASQGAGVDTSQGPDTNNDFTTLPAGVTESQATSDVILEQFFMDQTGGEGQEMGGTAQEIYSRMHSDTSISQEFKQEKIISRANWVVNGDPLSLGAQEQKNYLKKNPPTYAGDNWNEVVDCLYNPDCKKDNEAMYNNSQTFLENNLKEHDEINNAVKDRQKEENDRKKFLTRRKTIAGLIDIGVKWLWDNHLKDLGTLDNMRDKWGTGEASDFFNEYINSESWKNSLCNPESGMLYGALYAGSDALDDVLECTDTVCKPVISMAMEKAPYNETNETGQEETDYYIYTLVYYVGPAKQDYNYNVKFYYGNGDSYCVFQDDEGECSGDELIAGETGKDSTEMAIAFTSPNDYEKMCIEFNKPFPSIEAQGMSAGTDPKTKYCRTIVESAFFTGNPDYEYDETTGEGGGSGVTALFG